MESPKKNLIRGLLIALVIFYLLSCEDSTKESMIIIKEATTSQVLNSPYSINILVDKSKSIPKYGIPELTKKDFEPFVNLIEEQGGSLVVGVIGEFSDKVMSQLLITEGKPILPVPPNKENFDNVYHYRDARKQYPKDTSKYKYLLQQWEKQTQTKLDAFYSILENLLTTPINQNKTDIFGAVKRANKYHNARPKATQITMIISDGIDDVENEIEEVTGTVMLVFGSEAENIADKYPDFISRPNLQEAFEYARSISK